MAPNFGDETWKLSLESLWEAHEDAYDISHQSAFFDYLPYLIAKFTSPKIICYQSYNGFSTLACPFIPLLVSQLKQPHYPDTWPNKSLTLGANWQACGRHHGNYLIGKPMTTQPHQKQHMMISRLSLLNNNTISIVGKKLHYIWYSMSLW